MGEFCGNSPKNGPKTPKNGHETVRNVHDLHGQRSETFGKITVNILILSRYRYRDAFS
jgi:hypothetical protein